MAEETSIFESQVSYLFTTHGGGFTRVHFMFLQRSCEFNFYGLWLDSSGNGSQVYYFNSKRTIYLITVQLSQILKLMLCKMIFLDENKLEM